MVSGTDVNAEFKYRDAVSLYADSGLSIKEICGQTGVGFSAFSTYLSKHRRDLILHRHNLTHLSDVRLRGKRGQSTVSRYRYKDAIAACGSSEYIEYNISQVARIFDVDCSSLASQLRRHYPEITSAREIRRIGAAGRRIRGERTGNGSRHAPGQRVLEKYGKAIELYRTTSETIDDIVRAAGVSSGGFRHHLKMWHPELIAERRGYDLSTDLSQTRRYRKSTAAKYAGAIERMRSTDMPTAKVAAEFGLNPETFRMYLKVHHPGLAVTRGRKAQRDNTTK